MRTFVRRDVAWPPIRLVPARARRPPTRDADAQVLPIGTEAAERLRLLEGGVGARKRHDHGVHISATEAAVMLNRSRSPADNGVSQGLDFVSVVAYSLALAGPKKGRNE